MALIRSDNKMNGFDSKSYSIADFYEWNQKNQLRLSPKFQRRSVWKSAAKSYLIDTIIRRKPLPKIFIRQITEIETMKTIREVVDGQQRLRTILEFLSDAFKISSTHNKEYGDNYFSQLPDTIKSDILSYELSVDVLLGIDDSEILDIFARLNTYSVSLNKQELLNAGYFGNFKQLIYDLSFTYNKFWLDNGIFTDYKIMRMSEVELTTDIMIAMIDGIQNRKVAEKYYKKYDDIFENKDILENRFNTIMSLISKMFGDTLKSSNFSGQSLFYGMFLALYHEQYTLKGIDLPSKTIEDNDCSKIKNTFNKIDELVNSEIVPEKYQEFVNSVNKATSDALPRNIRVKYLVNSINEIIGN